MGNDANAKENKIDPAQVAELVRKVINRLQQNDTASSDARVITLDTIKEHQTTQLTVAPSAVITPAARDEARRRGIKIHRADQPATTCNKTTINNIIDADNPQRAETVRDQLQRRGAAIGNGTIVLSDSPAAEVHKQISQGNRATMITAIADVPRFAAELDPTVWVLDMKRLNIPAAVNAVVKIAQQGAR
jgi:hypothetical protein